MNLADLLTTEIHLPDIASGIKKIKNNAKRIAKNTALAALMLVAANQAYYLANDTYNTIRPSAVRKTFQSTFKFPLKGWSEDVDSGKSSITILANVLEKETREGTLELSDIRIESNYFLKKPFLDQLSYIFQTGHAGYYFPLLKTLVLQNNNSKWGVKQEANVIHHECKHAKTETIVRAHPELLSKWSALAENHSHESYYLTELEQAASGLRFIGPLVKKKIADPKNEKLGFISDYARTNVFEDIAELCAEAETSTFSSKKWLSDENNLIMKKLKLAQKYGLIPAEYIEFARLTNECNQKVIEGYGVNSKEAEKWFKKSEAFLKAHPKTIYESEIRLDRAFLKEHGAGALISWRQFYDSLPDKAAWEKRMHTIKESAIEEYKAALNCDYKTCLTYFSALSAITRIYGPDLNDAKMESIFSNAQKLYWQRYENTNNISLSVNVNDFLKENGVDLKKKELFESTK